MKQTLYGKILAGIMLVLVCMGTTWAQLVPPAINHQGIVKVSGEPFTGTGKFYFALAKPDGMGGYSNVWTSDGSQMDTGNRPTNPVNLPVTEGHYSVSLGDGSTTNGMDYTIFNTSGGQLWLRVWFNDGTSGIQKLNPDQPISSVPYAFTAQRLMTQGAGSHLDADTVDGQHASSLATSGHGHNLQNLSGAVNDAQVPDNITISYANVAGTAVIANSAVNATSATNATNATNADFATNAGNADTVDGQHAASFAATSHGHNLQDLPGVVTDAQVSNDITVTTATNATNATNADTVDGKHANNFWSTTGNSGTTPGTNFIGTTDNNAVEIKVNSTRAMRIEPNATSPNLIGGFNGNSVTAGVKGAAISGGGASGVNINKVTDDYGAVGGGRFNQAGDGLGLLDDAWNATVGGGYSNTAGGNYATVGGGNANKALGDYATVGGGDTNEASGGSSTVGGGSGNTASDTGATVSGGRSSEASNDDATVGGGFDNTASGQYSTVPGGRDNTASGTNSFAAGRRAKATAIGSFVWGDNTDADVTSTAQNQFTVRAVGGARFLTSSGGTKGVELAAGGGAWTSISDRNQKENFVPVDCDEVLDKVSELPLSTWNYKAQDTSIRHMGPMAQDLHAAFGLGETDTGITTIDADGVALASIQGLNRRLQEKDTRISKLEAEVEALKSMVKDLAAK